MLNKNRFWITTAMLILVAQSVFVSCASSLAFPDSFRFSAWLRSAREIPTISFATPRGLCEKVNDWFHLANPDVSLWVTNYIRERCERTGKIVVVVGSGLCYSKTSYLLLHQSDRINFVILGQNEYWVLQRYLQNESVEAAEFMSINEIKAKLDRIINQLMQYRTFYQAFYALVAGIGLGLSSSFFYTNPGLPLELGGQRRANLIPLSGLLVTLGYIWRERCWVYEDDAAISDDTEILLGFKEYLEDLKEDAYSNSVIRMLSLSDVLAPSPESRLARLQDRLDRLAQAA